METPIAPAMPCKIMNKNCATGGCGASNKNKTCVYSGSWWIQKTADWRIYDQIIMKTTLQEKETIHYNITIWFTKFIPMPQAIKKNQQQKQQWTRNGKNWRKFRRGAWQKSEVKKRWSMKQKRWAKKFILPHWWTYVIWKNAELEAKHQKYKGRIALRGDIVKDMQYSPNKDHHLLKWQQQKSWISSPDCQVAVDTQRTQYLLTPK